MTEARRVTKKINLRAGGSVTVQSDDFHPGQFRVSVGQGGAYETVLLDKQEAQRLSSMLLSALFDGGRIP
jgi:hypothetical protein